MKDLKNKAVKFPDGNEYIILAGKPIDDGKKSVYLLSISGQKANYSLWNVEELDKENVRFTPYNNGDTQILLKELLEKYLETAFD